MSPDVLKESGLVAAGKRGCVEACDEEWKKRLQVCYNIHGLAA
jgi:hypothetical protein